MICSHLWVKSALGSRQRLFQIIALHSSKILRPLAAHTNEREDLPGIRRANATPVHFVASGVIYEVLETEHGIP